MITNLALEAELDELLAVCCYKDYAPNGLQVEGRLPIRRLLTGVTACQALLDEAVAWQADAVLVHHGYFWGNEPSVIRGMKKRRLQTLLAHDINLFAYHLPLDGHLELGNNAQLARRLGIGAVSPLQPDDPSCLIFKGELPLPVTGEQWQAHLAGVLGREVLYEASPCGRPIERLAWCTGGGQGFIQQAAEAGMDAFISGEVSEQTIHVARELGIHFFAAGHHATERYGVQALGEWLAARHELEVRFLDIPNPA